MAEYSDVSEFRSLLHQTINFVCTLQQNNLLTQNIDLVKKFVDDETIKIIILFNKYTKDYKEQIMKEDEQFFLKNNFSKEVKANVDEKHDENFIMDQIFNVKSVWVKLDEETKTTLFTYAQALYVLAEDFINSLQS